MSEPDAAPLIEVGLRVNPLRDHLLVSTVLGKHIPVSPRVIREAADALAHRVRSALPAVDPDGVCVIGFAETATALSERISDTLGAGRVLTTTRYRGDLAPVHRLREEHSHAPEHFLLARVIGDDTDAVVIVDDEMTTGRTATAMIALVRAENPGLPVIVASLVDAMTDADRRRLVDEPGVFTRTVSLHRADPDEVARSVATLRAQHGAAAPTPDDDEAGHEGAPPVELIEFRLPAGMTATSRRAWRRHDRETVRTCAHSLAAIVAPYLDGACTVLGTEEAMWLPQLVAERLEQLGHDVRVGSTTRSPARAIDDPTYPLRSVRRWTPQGWAEPRFVYNVVAGGPRCVVVIVDDAFEADADAYVRGLSETFVTEPTTVVVVQLRRSAAAPREPVALRGPAFSTYRRDEVGWLLTDVSDWGLERPMAERERAIRERTAHYSESLPVEFTPSVSYLRAYERALERNAGRTAAAVSALAARLADAGSPPVLLSLARAGVPVGVLLREELVRRGIPAVHYAISIVRDRGLDDAALDAVVAAHGDAGIRFIDGWTGKGTIAGELGRSVRAYNSARGTRVPEGVWVLSDPLGVAYAAATNDDFLIPSACLNATVTGLISRTVRNDRTRAHGRFDGAAFYAHLATDDRTRRFLDAVSARMCDADAPPPPRAESSSVDAAHAVVADLMARFGVSDPLHLKPGLGEATRVLLRRPARALYLRRDAGADVEHMRRLALDRDVPVREVEDMPFLAVGIVDGGGE